MGKTALWGGVGWWGEWDMMFEQGGRAEAGQQEMGLESPRHTYLGKAESYS